MKGFPIGFWGKLERSENCSVEWHPLIDHCADVAAVCEALLRRTLIGKRLAHLGNHEYLTESDIQRLAVLIAFHDIGKFNLGFQNKADPNSQPHAGHVAEILGLLGDTSSPEQDRLIASMSLTEIADWATEKSGLELLVAAIAHHGRPIAAGRGSGPQRDIWQAERDTGIHLWESRS